MFVCIQERPPDASPPSLSMKRTQISPPLSAGHEAVSGATSGPNLLSKKEENLERRAQRCQRAPLLHWRLDLHFSFSWVTKYINTCFKCRGLAGLSVPTHTHTSTHTAFSLSFRMNLRKGRGDLTSPLWSMELSSTLSVLVMSDESSQMGNF